MAPIAEWRGDKWSPVVGRAIDRRLVKQRKMIARLVRLDDEVEIDALIDELSTELRRCWALLRDVNNAQSDPRIYQRLKALLRLPANLSTEVWKLDPNARGLIEDCWPGGPKPLESVAGEELDLRRAIESAIAALPVPRGGRPVGTRDYATRRLAQELAVIYQRFSSRKPTRRVRPDDASEYGPFKEFVSALVDQFPRQLRQYKSAPPGSNVKSVDNIVRIGIAHFRQISKAL